MSSSYPNSAVNLLRRQRRGRMPLTVAETSGGRSLATRRTIRRSDEAEQAVREQRGFEFFSKFWPGGIYSLTLSVWPSGTTRWHRDAKLQALTANDCDRKVLIGCTEVENLDQLSDLGMTEMGESVRPKRTKKFWKFKSMTNWGLRVLLTQSGSNLTWSNFVMQHEQSLRRENHR